MKTDIKNPIDPANSGATEMPNDFIQIANNLEEQKKLIINRLKTEGVLALKNRMEAEGIRILYVPEEIRDEECVYVDKAIVIEDNVLYVYGSYFEQYGDETEVYNEVSKQEPLSETQDIIESIPKLILDDSIYQESKQMPQDIEDMMSFFSNGEDSELEDSCSDDDSEEDSWFGGDDVENEESEEDE